MKCVILQPSYIPWRGYFDLIRRAGVFVFYDDVQYDTRGWRNRNRIKTPRGAQWLTIPVNARGAQTEHIAINRIATVPEPWARKHFETLRLFYGAAPHFSDYLPWLERAYAEPPPLLADFTIATTIELAGMLGISGTRFWRSSELGVGGGKTERLVNIARHVGATSYLSGPSAKSYIEPERFAEAGIALEYMEYGYPEYPQLYPPYDPQVSVLDLLFMTGAEAPRYIWG
ncbi:MAG TPA: WbqC family protein [Thermoanaerobaculia bacterium]|nr:WbqC family protein [Thermoanaerobaculia bacterium]